MEVIPLLGYPTPLSLDLCQDKPRLSLRRRPSTAQAPSRRKPSCWWPLPRRSQRLLLRLHPCPLHLGMRRLMTMKRYTGGAIFLQKTPWCRQSSAGRQSVRFWWWAGAPEFIHEVNNLPLLKLCSSELSMSTVHRTGPLPLLMTSLVVLQQTLYPPLPLWCLIRLWNLFCVSGWYHLNL